MSGVAARLLYLIALIALRAVAAHFSDPRHLPGPAAVFAAMGRGGVERAVRGLSYPLIFSRAKMQLEVGASLRRLSYDES